jgi:hypothetical protein
MKGLLLNLERLIFNSASFILKWVSLRGLTHF